MDVRCSQCGVEYEFDEEKVKPTGVTVKCTSCGHVFKVRRSSPEESTPFTTAPDGDGWMVRHRDGTVMRFRELTTLQKWIVEQKVGRDDAISRTGRTWRPLGDIAELASFFEVVEAANAAKTTPGRDAPAAPSAVTTTPFGVAAAESESGELTPPPVELQRRVSAAPLPPAHEDAAFYGAAVDELDDEDPVLAWRRRGRRRNAALAGVGLVLLGGAALFLLARPAFDGFVAGATGLVGLTPSETAPSTTGGPGELVARVEQSLLARDGNGPALLQELTATTVAEDAAPEHVAALSRLHADAAVRATEEASLLSAKRERGAADVDEALRTAKAAVDEHLAKAYAAAGRARTAAPELADADLAFAAYQAAKGAGAEVSADLDVARGHAPKDARVQREASVLLALAAAVAANDDEERKSARELLEKAQEASPKDARIAQAALVLAALSPAHDADATATRAAALAWRDAAPDDRRPALLLELLPAATAAEGTIDKRASPVSGDDVRRDKPTAAVEGQAPPTAKGTGPSSAGEDPASDDGAATTTEGYDSLIARADKERMRERTRAAVTLYKQAVDLRPRAAKPHVGLGWSYIDLDQMRAARSAFAYAISLDETLPEAHFGLAEAHRYGGDKAAAIRAYKRYLELAPSGADAPVARNALQALGDKP